MKTKYQCYIQKALYPTMRRYKGLFNIKFVSNMRSFGFIGGGKEVL